MEAALGWPAVTAVAGAECNLKRPSRPTGAALRPAAISDHPRIRAAPATHRDPESAQGGDRRRVVLAAWPVVDGILLASAS